MSLDNPKKLGFGLMRLPKKGMGIDVAQTAQMVDEFLDAGFTYFDTAYVYPGSEEATRKALVERHPRDSYSITTKLYATVAPTRGFAEREIDTSLKRLGTSYVDYYLLHSLMGSNVKKYERFGLWDYVHRLKRDGKIRHFGFSYHDGPELLDELLTKHPDVDFVQLQINYADWENASVQSRANHEVARAHDKRVVVMEPVKGGKLASPPAEVERLFRAYTPDASAASWAIRFVASLDGILTVLSGMSNLAQLRDNVGFMRYFEPLNAEERAIIRKAQQIMGASPAIPCTACRYCCEGCPKGIQIPDVFRAMNERLCYGHMEKAAQMYAAAVEAGAPASACVACGQCERVCPQHIEVIGQLKRCVEAFE